MLSKGDLGETWVSETDMADLTSSWPTRKVKIVGEKPSLFKVEILEGPLKGRVYPRAKQEVEPFDETKHKLGKNYVV